MSTRNSQRGRTLLCLVLSLAISSCTHLPASPLPSGAEIDAEAQRLMASEDVKGMAIAVIDHGEIVHVGAYGLANISEGRRLRTDTIMYGASLTKTAFAYFVLQLVDEELFDLDRPLASYLPKPLPEYEDYADLAGDERWRRLTARHVLNHTTGFANFRWLEDDGDCASTPIRELATAILAKASTSCSWRWSRA